MGSLAGGGGDTEVKRPVLYVTGYGPFRTHVVNASWEAVSFLPSMGLEERHGVKLIIEHLPVEYDFVDREIPQRWKKLDPILVVHVGMSKAANEVTLEKMAFNSSYCSPDVSDHLPEQGLCCPESQEDVLKTDLDLHDVSFQCQQHGFVAGVSTDAGRYLCEYLYRKSLESDRTRCVFIHVPDLDVLPSVEVARRLAICIDKLLEQISRNREALPTII